jgi:hypothetical protein
MAAILCLALLLAAASLAAAEKTLLIDDFEGGLRPGWEEKSFAGKTDYRVVLCDGGRCLRAESHDSASGLFFRLRVDPADYPYLSWRWKVANILEQGDERTKAGDDYAARVYVVFPHWFFPKTRTLVYIWANRLPRGESLPNPFTGNAMMVAVESGSEKVGQWVAERRNIVEDYRRAFGEAPTMTGAVAVMTDTDNTGGSATAWYDEIRLEAE